MNYRISESDRAPAYLQLYRLLRDDIVAGVYPYGSKLPSRRVLAEAAAVSTVTVEHAYALLCDEGYCEGRERSGYVVIFRTDDGFARPAAPPAGTGIRPRGGPGESVFPVSVLAKTMRAVLTDAGEAILDRPPGTGCPEAKSALRQYLRRGRGISVDEDQIVLGAGAEYLYRLLVELLGRDRIYGMESPSYHRIEQIYRVSGVRYRRLPLGADGIESAALRSTDTEVLHVTPYRSFPSGVTASASKRHEYLRWAARGDRYLVEDDFESEFSVSTKPEETLFSHGEGRVIYLNSFSKTIAPGLRVGYMVLPPALAGAFRERLGFCSCTVPVFEQLVLARLLDSGDFERHVNRVRRAERRRLQSEKDAPAGSGRPEGRSADSGTKGRSGCSGT